MITEKGYWIPDAVTADILLISLNTEGNLVGLFIERSTSSATEPGKIAIPGGHMDEVDADIEETAIRELHEETGIEISRDKLNFIGPFSRKDRDPRGRYIDMTYYAIVHLNVISNAIAGDDASNIVILELESAIHKDLAFDHKEIIMALKKKLEV